MTLEAITSTRQSGAYQNVVASTALERWTGRSVEIIQTASAAVSPYFRSKLVAILALVVASWASACGGWLASELTEKFIQATTSPKSVIQKNHKKIESTAFLIGWGGCVYAFAKFTDLPLGKFASTGISVATLAFFTLKDVG